MDITLKNSSVRPISEAVERRSASFLDSALVELAKTIPPGSVGPDFDPAVLPRSYLTGKVAKLRAKGALTLDYGVAKTKTGYALVRYTSPRLSPAAKWGRA